MRNSKNPKLEENFNNHLYQWRLQKVRKRKKMRSIWSIKKRTKNWIFFNSLLPTTLNAYIQALFLQTWKIQNQKFPKN